MYYLFLCFTLSSSLSHRKTGAERKKHDPKKKKTKSSLSAHCTARRAQREREDFFYPYDGDDPRAGARLPVPVLFLSSPRARGDQTDVRVQCLCVKGARHTLSVLHLRAYPSRPPALHNSLILVCLVLVEPCMYSIFIPRIDCRPVFMFGE